MVMMMMAMKNPKKRNPSLCSLAMYYLIEFIIEYLLAIGFSIVLGELLLCTYQFCVVKKKNESGNLGTSSFHCTD
jgi:hypothetical protein